MINLFRAVSALNSLDPSCHREDWVKIGMAAKSAGLSFEDFHTWSKYGVNYSKEKDCKAAWNSFKKSGGITERTLFGMAVSKGWQNRAREGFNNGKVRPESNACQNAKEAHRLPNESTNLTAFDVWERCLPAPAIHDYILRKHGKPHGLRYYPSTEPPLEICGAYLADYLVVPCWSGDELQTLQFIPPTKGGDKLNLKGAPFNDGYFTVGVITDLIYICEGIGQAWAANKASGHGAVVCFGSGRILRVAKILRAQYPVARLVIVPDRGKEKQAAEIAAAVDGQWIKLPQDKPENYDVNDYLLEHGEKALSDLLAHPFIEMPLSVIFADELPDDFTPPDELVEGVLVAGDGSILYGDSNSGKTFFVIDLACAVARGVDWMGRKTEPGLVIYLAAESPASVRRRLQAYQKHHNVRVKNFAIVQSPIDLFDGESDTDLVIQAVRLLEKQYGQKARLIVGDTLARLSAGANECAGQDMGLVVRHFDRIRNECDAHFMLIHHSGKNAAAGARGWSGVRAAVDTEIEVTDSPAGRCAEITKQRDLGTKGTRIGFKLEVVPLGETKWGAPATSCVVVSAGAPDKNTSKRLSEIAGAIIEYLSTTKSAVKKTELVKHFKDRYSSSAIYRELQKLVKQEQVSDSCGYVRYLVPTGAN